MSEPLVTWFLGSDTDAPTAKKGIGLLDDVCGRSSDSARSRCSSVLVD